MNWFAASPHRPRLPDEQVRRVYPRFRWRVMEATYIGYASYYLLRNNISVVAKDIQGDLGYDKAMIGGIMAATGLSYGLGKFVMGAWSDRSNPRVFMAAGLLLTAMCNFAFATSQGFSIDLPLFWRAGMPWSTLSIHGFHIHLGLWALNGFFQGMGWPPCGRCMGHWFSERERGLTFSIWNTAHNVGGGVTGYLAGWSAHHFGWWQFSFYVPGTLALIVAVYLFWRLVDTPQSVGLPPVEEYKNDYPETRERVELERELSFRELLFKVVLVNRWVWVLAAANFFAYIARYSMIDWGPTYLREVKGASQLEGGFSTTALEFAGIPSTILLGWLSDRLSGRRGMVATLCMAPIPLVFGVILITPPGWLKLDLLMLALIGFLIYPVINLIVIMALDLTGKKAIGTAAGFIGLMGYLGKAAKDQGFGSLLKHYEPILGQQGAWAVVIGVMLGSAALAVLLLALTWRLKPRA